MKLHAKEMRNDPISGGRDSVDGRLELETDAEYALRAPDSATPEYMDHHAAILWRSVWAAGSEERLRVALSAAMRTDRPITMPQNAVGLRLVKPRFMVK